MKKAISDDKNNKQKLIDEVLRETQVFKKLLNYGERLINDEEFLSELVWFRKHWGHKETGELMPLGGLPLPDCDSDKIHHHYIRLLNIEEDDYLNQEEYEERQEKLETEYGLNFYGEAFDYLLFYGTLKPMFDMGCCAFLKVVNLSQETDLEKKDIFGGEKTIETFYESMTGYAEDTPIAILINPFMSQNDIIDSIRKTYKSVIEPEQKSFNRYKISVDKTRASSQKNKQRDEFILKNSEMPIIELTSEVNKRFRKEGDYYDYSYVQSLLTKEINKQKLTDRT